MPRNLPIAFAELVIGGVLLESAIRDSSLTNVVRGTPQSGTGLSSMLGGASDGGSTGNGGGSTATASGTAPTATLSSLGFGTGEKDAVSDTDVSNAPAAVTRALGRANSLVGAPYVYGGGHSTSALTATAAAIKKAGIDCSGFVSNVLGPSGLGALSSPEATGGLSTSLQSGAGKWITVFDRSDGVGGADHTIIDIAGRFFESGGNSSYNPNGGVTAMTDADARGELAGGGFQIYHPTGY